MNRVDAKRFEDEFKRLGWLYEYGEDQPNTVYTPHAHGWTKLVTLGGSLRIRTDRGWSELHSGEVCEVRSGELHEAIIGDGGWRWLAAWKPEEDATFTVHGS